MVVVALLALRAMPSGAQPALRFERLGVEEGLSNPVARQVAQDDTGFIWIATEYGVHRFDGHEVRVFEHEPSDPGSLIGSYVEEVFADRKGGVWVRLVLDGVTRIASSDGVARRFVHDPTDSTGITPGRITAHAIADDGELWVGSELGGVDRFDSSAQMFRPVLRVGLGSEVTALEPDGVGGMWMSTHDDLIHVGASLEPESMGKYAPDGLRPTCLLNASGGGLWVGTRSGLWYLDPDNQSFQGFGTDQSPRLIERIVHSRTPGVLWVVGPDGLYRFDQALGSWSSVPVDSEDPSLHGRTSLPSDTVLDLHEDQQGFLWIGTESGLVSRDPSTGEFRWHRHHPSDPYSMPLGVVFSILEDRSGVLWFGTVGGVARFNPRQRWFRHELYTLLGRGVIDGFSVSAVVQDSSGTIWVGTVGQGLIEYGKEPGLVRHRHDPDDAATISSDLIETLHISARDPGVLWIGSRAGVDRFELATRRSLRFQPDPGDPHSLGGPHVRSLLEDRRGDLWVALSNGLDRRDAATGQFEHIPCPTDGPNGTDRYQVFAIHETRDGDLWFGVVPTGLFRYRPADGTFVQFDEAYTGSPAVPRTIHCFYEDPRGDLWIGTFSDGLMKLDRTRNTFSQFTRADGLPSNRIVSILADDHGNLWLGTNRGLARFDPVTGTVRTFRASDGLQADEFWEEAACRTPNGELLFGGVDGITRFAPDALEQNLRVPSLALVSFEVPGDGKPRPVAGTNRGRPIELDRRDASLTFQFAVLDFTVPEQNSYAYRLEGYDREWTRGERSGTYRNLPPGDYRLQLRGANSDGVWNEEGIVVELSVPPAFWQRPVFYLPAAILFIGLGLLLHRARVESASTRVRELQEVRQAERERMREDAARDLHDEMGHLVSRISLSSGIARRNIDDAPTARRHLDQVATTSRALADAMGDFLWTLDTRSDSAEDVVLRLKDSGDEMFRGTGISFRVLGLTPHLADVRLPVDGKRNVTMMFKEAMHNTFKHAASTEVHLEIELRGNCLWMSLTDNGCGFVPEPAQSGLGLASIRNRAARLGGTVSIQSAPGRGTRIRFEVAVDPGDTEGATP